MLQSDNYLVIMCCEFRRLRIEMPQSVLLSRGCKVAQVIFQPVYSRCQPADSLWMIILPGFVPWGEYNNYVCVVRYRGSGIEIAGCGHSLREGFIPEGPFVLLDIEQSSAIEWRCVVCLLSITHQRISASQ